jgi:tRNA-dihydrouridine synthase B
LVLSKHFYDLTQFKPGTTAYIKVLFILNSSPSDITIILAPLQGFTDVTFRNVFSRHFKGVDEAVAPFISTMGECRLKPSRLKDVLPENNRLMPVIPQILSNVPEDFIFLATHLYNMGHTRINWNLGCPHSKIAKKKRGSGLLCHPDMVDDFLARTVHRIPNTLSVKIRLGRYSDDEINTLLPIFDAYDLEEVILHPRTGIQMYQGLSDHDAFEKATQKSRHTFVYNGDITDPASFEVVRQRFGAVSRFMIGRGILANPFLTEQIKNIEHPTDPLDRLEQFHNDLFDSYRTIFSGPGHLTGRMKGFWTYLGPSFENSKKQVKQILKSRSIDQYQDAVNAIFSKKSAFSG